MGNPAVPRTLRILSVHLRDRDDGAGLVLLLLSLLVAWAAFASLCRLIYDSRVGTFVLGSVPSLLPLISSTASSLRESVRLFQRRSYLLRHSGQSLWAPAVRFSRHLTYFSLLFFSLALLRFGSLVVNFFVPHTVDGSVVLILNLHCII